MIMKRMLFSWWMDRMDRARRTGASPVFKHTTNGRGANRHAPQKYFQAS
jgi:hypothetical protein